MAPEVFGSRTAQRLSGYGLPADVWSYGMTVFAALVGGSPYGDDEDKKITEKRQVLFITSEWVNLPDAESFIQHLLLFDPEHRSTMDKCLRHHWLQMNNISNRKRSKII